MSRQAAVVIKCTVGKILGDNKCILRTYSKREAYFNLKDFSENDLRSLQYRISYHQPLEGNICSYHRGFYIKYYDNYIYKCCNPVKLHVGVDITKGLRIISLILCQNAEKVKIKIIPGDKLCVNCESKLKSMINVNANSIDNRDPISNESSVMPSDSPASNESPIFSSGGSCYVTKSQEKNSLHNALTKFGVDYTDFSSNITKLPKERRSREVTNLLDDLFSKFAKKVFADLNLNQPHRHPGYDSLMEDSNSFKKITLGISSAVQNSQNVTDKLKYLILLPEDWSLPKILKYIPISQYLHKQLLKLRAHEGDFGFRLKKKVAKFSDEMKQKIIAYYLNEKNCYTFPGKQQYKSVKPADPEKRYHAQKRLLLFSLPDLFKNFREDFKHERVLPGFTFFFQLKPQECVCAGDPGTHTICVCVEHENIKLMLSALPGIMKYGDLLETAVCSTDNMDCMLHRCKKCPGIEGIQVALSQEAALLNDNSTVTYTVWEDAGTRANLITKEDPILKYKTKLLNGLWNLTIHHHTAKVQQDYLQQCKDNLELDTCIIQMDFSENYSFIIQRSIQAYYYNNLQATIHPLVMYYKNENGILQHINFCIISDAKEHQAFAVNCFLKKCLEIVKNEFSWIKNVIYFSDGAPSQYKNKNHLINMYHHEKDFGLKVKSCNFFATDHGKSVCDAIGGTIKGTVMRHCKRSTPENQITNPKEMYDYASSNIKGIRSLWVPNKEVQQQKRKLLGRFNSVRTFYGTRKYHCFIPQAKSLQAKLCSADDKYFTFEV